MSLAECGDERLWRIPCRSEDDARALARVVERANGKVEAVDGDSVVVVHDGDPEHAVDIALTALDTPHVESRHVARSLRLLLDMTRRAHGHVTHRHQDPTS